MHTTGYLLVLAVLMASAYKTIVRTYEPANKLKQAVSNEIVASAGLGAFSLSKWRHTLVIAADTHT